MTWTHFHDRWDNAWELGDLIEIVVSPDEAVFNGILQEIHPDYILINGCGFLIETIIVARPYPGKLPPRKGVAFQMRPR